MLNQQQKQRIKTRKTINGFIIEIDPTSWALMMTALGTAIDASDQNGLPAEKERAANLRTLRTALSQASR